MCFVAVLMIRVTYEWAMARANAACHTYEWAMSHIWMSQMGISHVAYEYTMAHTWMIHFTHMNEWSHMNEHGTNAWIVSHMYGPCHDVSYENCVFRYWKFKYRIRGWSFIFVVRDSFLIRTCIRRFLYTPFICRVNVSLRAGRSSYIHH